MTRGLFVTGTDTGVGKTVTAVALLRAFVASGRRAVGMKPVSAGVAALVVTEIGRDGTLEGPALDQLSDVLAATRLDVVASGGVGSLDDLRALADLRVDGRRLAGAIVGRALYEGAFQLSDAVSATRSDHA